RPYMARACNRWSNWSGLVAALPLVLLVNAAQAEFTTLAGWDQQLFPSYAVATATLRQNADAEEADETELGDPRGILGVEVESPADDAAITGTTTSSEIMQPSTFTGTLAKQGETYTIRPRIKYKYSALTQTRQATPISVTFGVKIGDGDAEEQTETLTLRSIND